MRGVRVVQTIDELLAEAGECIVQLSQQNGEVSVRTPDLLRRSLRQVAGQQEAVRRLQESGAKPGEIEIAQERLVSLCAALTRKIQRHGSNPVAPSDEPIEEVTLATVPGDDENGMPYFGIHWVASRILHAAFVDAKHPPRRLETALKWAFGTKEKNWQEFEVSFTVKGNPTRVKLGTDFAQADQGIIHLVLRNALAAITQHRGGYQPFGKRPHAKFLALYEAIKEDEPWGVFVQTLTHWGISIDEQAA